MQNRHQKLSFYQLFVLFFAEIPYQGMNINIILTIIINIPPVLIATTFHYDILLLIQIQVSLFQHLLLQHTRWYLLNITQTIKHIEILTSFKYGSLFNNSIPINSQQLTLFFLGKAWYWIIRIKTYLLFQIYILKWNRTSLFILPIFKFNW